MKKVFSRSHIITICVGNHHKRKLAARFNVGGSDRRRQKRTDRRTCLRRGNVIRFAVENNTLFATAALQMSPTDFPGEFAIEYAYREPAFVMKSIAFNFGVSYRKTRSARRSAKGALLSLPSPPPSTKILFNCKKPIDNSRKCFKICISTHQ
jgi:hypothetical protein